MNINEIAKLAGVSRATVSRYLNEGYVRKDRLSAIDTGTDAPDEKDAAGRGDPSEDQFRYGQPDGGRDQ